MPNEDETNNNYSAESTVPSESQTARFEAEPSTGSSSQVPLSPQSLAPVSPAPVSPTPPTSNGKNATGFSPMQPKKSKKGLIIALIGGGVLLVLIIVAVLTYFLYFQNPQKVLGDAISNLYIAKATSGTITYEPKDSSGESKATIKFSAASKASQYSLSVDASIDYHGKTINVKGDGAYDKDGNVYFKLSGLQKLLQTAGGEYETAYGTLIKKYDDKWIKVSASDLKSISPDYEKRQKCTDDINRRLNDKSFQNDLGKAYRENQFIKIEKSLGTKDGNFGYQIKGDKTKAKAFAEAFNKTKSYEAIKENCGDFATDSTTESTKDDDNETTYKVWVSQWSHQLKTFEISTSADKYDVNLTTNLDYKESKDVTIPKDSVSLNELKKDLESAVYGSATYQGAQYRAATSGNQRNASVVVTDATSYASNHNGKYPTISELKSEYGAQHSEAYANLTTSAASSSNPSNISYLLINSKNGYVLYYDTELNKTQQIPFGSGDYSQSSAS